MKIHFDQATITLTGQEWTALKLIAQAVHAQTDPNSFFQPVAHLGLTDHETRDAALKLAEYIACDAP